MRKHSRIPVIIDNDTREVVVIENKPKPLFDYSQPLFQANLFVSTDEIVNHFSEALCTLLGCKNGGLADKAPQGKKVYLAQAEHVSIDHAVKLLHKQLKTQVSFRRKTVRFTEVNIQHKFNYRVKVKLYLED